jgi:hypothetical protein
MPAGRRPPKRGTLSVHNGMYQLRCVPCLVAWKGSPGEPCWMCGEESELGPLLPTHGDPGIHNLHSVIWSKEEPQDREELF